MHSVPQNRLEILGVPIDVVSQAEAHYQIEKLISHGGGVVFTPNSEIIVAGVMDPAYRSLFSKADLCLPDTTGLIFASLGLIRQRVPGSDTAGWLLNYCEQKKLSVAIVIREGGFSSVKEVREAVHAMHPNLELHIIETDGSVQKSEQLVRQIHSDVVLVGLGYPLQERWINAAKPRAKNVKLWMAIGGTCDYWTNKKPRAPKVFRKMGVEWLWRLLIQPTRVFRIIKAVIVFPWLVFILKNQPLHQTQ